MGTDSAAHRRLRFHTWQSCTFPSDVATGQIDDILEPGGLQDARADRRSSTAAALNDQFFISRKLVEILWQTTKEPVLGLFDVTFFPFFVRANVEQLYLARFDTVQQVRWCAS